MKKEIKEKPGIEEFIKKETTVKKHFKPFCLKWDQLFFTAFAKDPSDNCNIASHAADSLSHLLNTLVVTYAIGYGKYNLYRALGIGHGA